MKQPQDYKQPQSKQPQLQQYLDTLKEIRSEKDLDQLQELIVSILTIYGVNLDEASALLYSIMRLFVNQEHNKRKLADNFKIDVTKLGDNELSTILKIQEAMCVVYARKVKDNDSA